MTLTDQLRGSLALGAVEGVPDAGLVRGAVLELVDRAEAAARALRHGAAMTIHDPHGIAEALSGAAAELEAAIARVRGEGR